MCILGVRSTSIVPSFRPNHKLNILLKFRSTAVAKSSLPIHSVLATAVHPMPISPNISASEVSTSESSVDLSYSDISYSQIDNDMSMIQEDINPTSRSVLEEEPASGSVPVIEEIEQDPIYFCENVTLKAEDRLFSVPKRGLVDHGTFFRSLFGEETTDVDTIGSSSKNPIILDGVSKIDFHNFLRVIYPFRGVDPPSGDEHWLGILDLATKWGFQEIREDAITQLEHMFISSSHNRDPIRALYLCQKYDITQHIQHQYETLITSITPLDYRVMLDGGIDNETILQLMNLRDRWLCGYVWGGRGSGIGIGDYLPTRVSAQKLVEEHLSPLDHWVGAYRDPEPVEQCRRAAEDSKLLRKVEDMENLEKALMEEMERNEMESKENARHEADRLEKEAEERVKAEEEWLKAEADKIADHEEMRLKAEKVARKEEKKKAKVEKMRADRAREAEDERLRMQKKEEERVRRKEELERMQMEAEETRRKENEAYEAFAADVSKEEHAQAREDLVKARAAAEESEKKREPELIRTWFL